MKNVRRLQIILVLMVLAMMTGCVQKAKISVLEPGEIKLTGVSKIALLDFNTIPSTLGGGGTQTPPGASSLKQASIMAAGSGTCSSISIQVTTSNCPACVAANCSTGIC
ncbi:MAG: hypothetical protein PHS63_03180 [Desulfoplanes sp.]|nr:hypothetical protein [Desulfoplanes sp.]